MKTTLILALALSPLALQAQTEAPSGEKPAKEERQRGPRGERGPRGPLPAAVVEKFDTDGDGKLNKEERKAAMEARRAQALEKFDADGDGKLNEEERAAAHEARRAAMIERFDTDGDGKLSKEERQAAREQSGRPKAGPRGPKPAAE